MKATYTSLSRFAVIAGVSLLLMAITAGFSFGYAHSLIVQPDDAIATLQNLLNSKGLFQAEILGWCLILILDVIVAWALYHFFKSVSKPISAFTAWIRIIYSIILGMAIGQLMNICNLLNETTAQVVMDDFQSCFNDADQVYVTPVYEAGEDPIDGVNADSLVAGLKSRGHRSAATVTDHAELAQRLAEDISEGDMVVCLGAGDITKWAAGLADAVEAARL